MSSIHHQELGTGHPLVLIHGFCETHEIWKSVATELSKDFKVYLPDLPGFGKSPLPKTPFTIDEIGSLMVDWLQGQGLSLNRTVVVGHSLGGYVAMAMAVKNQKSVLGLGLFHSTAVADSEEKKANRNKTAEFVKANGVAPFVEVFVPGLFHQKDNPFIQRVTEIALTTPVETLLSYTLAMRDRPSREEWLKTFEKGFLIVAGENDSIIPLNVLEQQSGLAVKTHFKTLKNTGHMGMYEATNDTISVLRDFASACF
jgi:pimeloyl-ACP methyl ester carboxylesterase